MFAAGSNLKGKSDGDIFYQDFKRFTVGNSVFGIGQITSLNAVELKDLRTRMSAYTEKEREQHEIDMMFFMLTNILTESTDLICTGQGAEQILARIILREKRHLHGEVVGFGVLLALLVDRQEEEFEKIYKLNREIGLPVSLKEIEITEDEWEESMNRIPEMSDVAHYPYRVTKEMRRDAMDRLKERAGKDAYDTEK